MSNLESIVPPLELCKRIPAGEFEDSALVWVDGNTQNPRIVFVEPRRYAIDNTHRPAPTLEEVLEAIGEVESWDTATITRPIGANARIVDTALKRWFEVKGIEVK